MLQFFLSLDRDSRKFLIPSSLIWVGSGRIIFALMVKDVWLDHDLNNIPDAQRRLVEKLSNLKCRVKIWAKEKLLRDTNDLKEIEETLVYKYEQMFTESSDGLFDQSVINLEKERKRLLLAEEEQWRQKSRAIWIKCGDKNTKFFHKYVSYRRNKKFIWEIQDESGVTHSGQEAIKTEASKFYKSFFNDTGPNFHY
jgi:hypothetical protein